MTVGGGLKQYPRRIFIDDALAGASSLYADPEVYWFPFIDYLQLLLQQPVIITFHENGRLLRTSLQDPELMAGADLSTPPERAIAWVHENRCVYVGVQVLRVSGGGVFALEVEPARISSREMDEFADLLVAIPADVTSKVFAALVHRQSPSTTAAESIPTTALCESTVERVRRAIDNALDGAMRAASLRNSPTFKGVPNLFCVLRSRSSLPPRREYFGYDLRPMLTTMQRDALLKHAPQEGERGAAALVKDFERPLGRRSRSIADSVFADGVCDFSGEDVGQGRDDIGDPPGEDDTARREAERFVFSSVLPSGDRIRTFYMPVHLNGVPWVSLFTLTSFTNGADAWWHNYHLYRTLVPGLSDALRVAFRDAHREAVVALFAQEFASKDPPEIIAARMNQQLGEVWTAFPYPRLEFVLPTPTLLRSAAVRDDLAIPIGLARPGEALVLRTVRGSEHPQQVRHDPWDDLRQIADMCEGIVHREKSFVLTGVRDRLRETIAAHSHSVFNTMPSDASIGEIQQHIAGGRMDRAAVRLDDIRKRLRETALIVHSLFDSGVPVKHGISTVTDLLLYLRDTTPSGVQLRFDQRGTDDDVVLNDETFVDVFTLLWNLWHNASKFGRAAVEKRFRVLIERTEDATFVEFENSGTLPDGWLDYLTRKTLDSPNPSNVAQGLEIVRSAVERLSPSCSFTEVTNTDGRVRVTLRIARALTTP